MAASFVVLERAARPGTKGGVLGLRGGRDLRIRYGQALKVFPRCPGRRGLGWGHQEINSSCETQKTCRGVWQHVGGENLTDVWWELWQM